MPTLSHTPPPYMRRCDRHSVFFNREKYDSCAVCRASVHEPRLALSSAIMAAAGALLVATGLYLAGGPLMNALARAGDEAIARTSSTIRIDPGPVSAQILNLENLVYASNGHTTVGEIQMAAVTLAEAVETIEGPPLPLLSRFKGEINQFGTKISTGASIHDTVNTETVKTEWETVRGRVFAAAPWLGRQ